MKKLNIYTNVQIYTVYVVANTNVIYLLFSIIIKYANYYSALLKIRINFFENNYSTYLYHIEYKK